GHRNFFFGAGDDRTDGYDGSRAAQSGGAFRRLRQHRADIRKVIEMQAQHASPVDPILVEVIGNRLYTLAREMLISLIRAAYSTNIKERYDCATGIFNIDGEQVALACYPPLHTGGIRSIVQLLVREYPVEELRPGDM